MKKIFIISVLFSSLVFAADQVSVRIDSMTNLANNSAIEVCGTAVSASKSQTILITLKHDESEYTTLTNSNGKFCQVIKRWNFKGEVTATGRAL